MRFKYKTHDLRLKLSERTLNLSHVWKVMFLGSIVLMTWHTERSKDLQDGLAQTPFSFLLNPLLPLRLSSVPSSTDHKALVCQMI